MITNANGTIYNPQDVYNVLRTKAANDLRYSTYFDILLNTLLEMFEYDGLPDTIPQRFLELYLHTYGNVFVSKINGDLYATGGTLSGEIDAYGLGTDAIAVCPVGQAQGKRDIDIVYGINNSTASPDMLVYWIAHLLQENDNSLEHTIIYSRLLPIPVVRDEKEKAAFDELIDTLIKGDLKAFASKNLLADELEQALQTINLSDANKVDKLQYLSRFADDILKKFYNFYGQPINSQNKSAQSISDEIHGMDSVSFIIPIQMLKCREKMCEDINRIFGLNVSVKFSTTWALEYNALMLRDTNGNGTADTKELNNDQEPDQEPTQEPDQEPTQEPDQEPTQEPDQEPDQEPTQEPDQEPDQEPENDLELEIMSKLATALDTTIEELAELVKGGEEDA